MVGRARERAVSYTGRCVVFREVNGLVWVGALSRRRVHFGMVEMSEAVGDGDVEAGSESVGPRVRAPPVNGEGVNFWAG